LYFSFVKPVGEKDGVSAGVAKKRLLEVYHSYPEGIRRGFFLLAGNLEEAAGLCLGKDKINMNLCMP
jgi:hypothetical protein